MEHDDLPHRNYYLSCSCNDPEHMMHVGFCEDDLFDATPGPVLYICAQKPRSSAWCAAGGLGAVGVLWRYLRGIGADADGPFAETYLMSPQRRKFRAWLHAISRSHPVCGDGTEERGDGRPYAENEGRATEILCEHTREGSRLILRIGRHDCPDGPDILLRVQLDDRRGFLARLRAALREAWPVQRHAWEEFELKGSDVRALVRLLGGGACDPSPAMFVSTIEDPKSD